MAGSKLHQIANGAEPRRLQLGVRLRQNDVIAAVETSRQILDAFETLTPDDRQAALDVMTAYERDVLRETTWRARPR